MLLMNDQCALFLLSSVVACVSTHELVEESSWSVYGWSLIAVLVARS
jgi:hypothetical protein